MTRQIIRLSSQEPATVLVEDYCRLRHNEDGSIEFLIIDTNGRAKEYCFNTEGEYYDFRQATLDPAANLEEVEI